MEYEAGLGSQETGAQGYSKWENQEMEIVEEPTRYTSLIQWRVMADGA